MEAFSLKNKDIFHRNASVLCSLILTRVRVGQIIEESLILIRVPTKECDCPVVHGKGPDGHPTMECKMIVFHGPSQHTALKQSDLDEDTVDEGLDLPDSPDNWTEALSMDLKFPCFQIKCDGEHPSE